MRHSHSARAAALAAALCTTIFNSAPVQVATLGAGALALTAGAAMAQSQVPGVGIIIKRKPGNAPIARGVSDANGAVSFKLEPGAYSVTVGRNKPQNFTIAKGQTGVQIVVWGTKESYVGKITVR